MNHPLSPYKTVATEENGTKLTWTVQKKSRGQVNKYCVRYDAEKGYIVYRTISFPDGMQKLISADGGISPDVNFKKLSRWVKGGSKIRLYKTAEQLYKTADNFITEESNQEEIK